MYMTLVCSVQENNISTVRLSSFDSNDTMQRNWAQTHADRRQTLCSWTLSRDQ